MSDDAWTMTVRTLTAAGARCALDAAERAAMVKGLAVSIAVVDHVGNLVAFLRVGNACVTSIEAALRKPARRPAWARRPSCLKTCCTAA